MFRLCSFAYVAISFTDIAVITITIMMITIIIIIISVKWQYLLLLPVASEEQTMEYEAALGNVSLNTDVPVIVGKNRKTLKQLKYPHKDKSTIRMLQYNNCEAITLFHSYTYTKHCNKRKRAYLTSDSKLKTLANKVICQMK